MVRILGGACVFGASALLGFGLWRRLVRRVWVLKSILQAFRMLRTEIEFLQTPLCLAVRKIAERSADTIFAAFAYALEIGKNPSAAMDCALVAAEVLTDADASVLREAALSLGESDAATQGRHIEAVLGRLQTCVAEAEARVQVQGKLCMSGGMLGGMLLLILLL